MTEHTTGTREEWLAARLELPNYRIIEVVATI